MRWWAFWRRVQYGSGTLAFFALCGVGIYFLNYYQSPTCFDNRANGNERGVDCGGDCVRICVADVQPLQVVWAKSFEVTEGQYNAVAYIDNPNQVAATPEMAYTLELYNEGRLVAERTGTTIVPPNSEYPIFEGRIFTDNREPVTETRLVIDSAELWLPASIGRDQFRSVDIELLGADVRPRLNVEVENTELVGARDVEVVATIFNEIGEPVTASQTFIESIAARSTEDIVFTWPNPIAKTVRSCIIPTDVVLGIDLSGSMNNDSDDPPQPLTDALSAAAIFANSLQEDDQIGVVTFATRAETTTSLTNLHGAVANAIASLEIAPAEEVGFTNTEQAFEFAQEELNSARHNEDARRVLVLLTDGLPTAPGDTEVIEPAIARAQELAADGIEVYSIGLGTDVDAEFIRRIASDQSNAYFAPNSADLQSIYAEITSSLCESGPTRIDVIAKTETNFAPLR